MPKHKESGIYGMPKGMHKMPDGSLMENSEMMKQPKKKKKLKSKK